MADPVDDPSRPSAAPLAMWWLVTWFVAAIAGSIVLTSLHRPGDGVALGPPIGVLGASLVALWAVQLTGTALASRRFGTGDPLADFGLTARPVDLIGVPIGVAAQFVLVPLVYVPLRALDGDLFSDERLDDTASDLVARADGAQIWLLFALVVIGAPIVEEIFYRGMLQRPLLGRAPSWMVVVGVAAVFAAIHMRPVELPGLFVIGLVLGALAAWSGRIGPAVAAHVGFNAAGLLAVL